MERHTIHYSGQVQGVGFRWKTEKALEGAQVTGFVRNLADGRVELVLEGEAEALGACEERVRALLEGHIRHESRVVSAPTLEFVTFRVERT